MARARASTPPGEFALFAPCPVFECPNMTTSPGQPCDSCAAKRARTPRCLYQSPAHDLAARATEFGAWCAEFGSFGSLVRSHAWKLGLYVPTGPADRRQPTVLSVDVRNPARWKHDTSDMPDCTCEELLNYWETHARPTEAYFRGEDTRLGYAGQRRKLTSAEQQERDWYERFEHEERHGLAA